jgi:hypothetical protein
MDWDTAKSVEEILRGVTADLNESIRIVQEKSEADEFIRYRQLVGKLMGEIFLDILQPLYSEFPDLLPSGLQPPDNPA